MSKVSTRLIQIITNLFLLFFLNALPHTIRHQVIDKLAVIFSDQRMKRGISRNVLLESCDSNSNLIDRIENIGGASLQDVQIYYKALFSSKA
jgi:hypothetical protein